MTCRRFTSVRRSPVTIALAASGVATSRVAQPIALDMIGHGYTDKPDHDHEIRHYVKHLLDFSNALGLKRIHLYGETLGGWIAAQFAIDHPDVCSSDANENTNRTDSCCELLRVFSMRRENFPEN
jgi:pimeloyl-ACP methyl ester carboxylesterase